MERCQHLGMVPTAFKGTVLNAEAVLRALQAGVDQALWITTDEVPAVLDRLEKAVNAGELNMGAVEASVLRMGKGPNPRCGG